MSAFAIRRISCSLPLKEKAEVLGLDDLALEAQELDRDAAEFEEQKLDSVRKKTLRSESYRVRSQQQMY